MYIKKQKLYFQIREQFSFLNVLYHSAIETKVTAIAAAHEHDDEIHLGVKFGHILLMPI